MEALARQRNWTDYKAGGRERTRRIQTHANRVTPTGLVVPCARGLREKLDRPENWAGLYEGQHASEEAALQAYVGDSTDPGNTALVMLRLSERPSCWVNFKAVNVNPVQKAVDEAGAVEWAGLWDNANLRLEFGAGRVNEVLTLTAPGHPAAFRWAVRQPAGHGYELLEDGSLSIRDQIGVEWLRCPQPSAEDANGQPVRVARLPAPNVDTPRGSFPTFRTVPLLADLQAAAYPVEVR